jgi:hypothetical protein
VNETRESQNSAFSLAIAGPVGCQSSFWLMKIPMLLRLAWAAAKLEAAIKQAGIK